MKKIKVTLKKEKTRTFYVVNAAEVRMAFKYIDLPSLYQWIMNDDYVYLYLSKNTINDLNKIWKNQKK